MTDAAPHVIEPVHLGSRLVRAHDITYTEVDGHAVLCQSEDRTLYAPSPVAVELWAALDGRPLRDLLKSLGVEEVSGSHREIIELLRRLKASGLIVDLEPDTDADFVRPIGQSAGMITTMDVNATTSSTPHGNGSSDAPSVTVTLTGPPAESITVTIDPGNGPDQPISLSVDGVPVANVRIDPEAQRINLPEPVAPGEHLTPITALAAWVVAIADSEQLRSADVVDTLAAVAEAVPVEVFTT